MDDVRSTGPVRPNLWADRLTSYAFGVEAAFGHKPMRYLLARRFDEERPGCALTVLFVVRPEVLLGTYVRISEGAASGCEVHTFLPTMTHPIRVADAMVFDCLPLTDVGYVDLMAWPHPELRAMDIAETAEGDLEGLGSPSITRFRYQGPPSVPALVVCEEIDAGRSMVVRRVLYRGEQQVRRWEITEHGAAGQETLPRRIRVSRPQTGHETEFVRTGPAMPVPPSIFDEEPDRLRDWLEKHLIRE